MNGHVILIGFCLGGAALAVWLLLRFPSFGPRRLSSTVLAVLAIALGVRVAAALFDALAGVGRYGVTLGLLVVVFPALTMAFWLSACVLRALADMPGLRR